MTDWRPRRTVLYTPATRTDRWLKALDGPADVVVADLEDAVAPEDKDGARAGVVDALASAGPKPAEVAVRINPWPSSLGHQDVDALVDEPPQLIVVPKVEDTDAVASLDDALAEADAHVGLMLLFETARGVLNAPALAAASPRVRAVAFGALDYAASVGARLTDDATEVLWARSRVVAAAAAAGVDAIDMIRPDYSDLEGLARETRFAAQLGFDGKMVIHPQQVPVVHEALRPTDEEIAWAEKVLDAVAAEGVEEGGIVVVDGRMVDVPLIRQAERIARLADL